MKKNTNQSAEPPPPRRRFLRRLWSGLLLVALTETVWALFAFLRPGRPAVDQADGATRVTVGKVDDFAPESVTAFPRGHFYLVRQADGGFLALSRRCTHLGCTVPWQEKEKRFICPCHASIFDIHGAVIQSPATRALDLYRVTVENGSIQVDNAAPIKRSGYDRAQAVYAN